MPRLITAAIALLCCAATACTPLPSSPTVRGLYVDVRKAVDFQEQLDWTADNLEVDAAMRTVMGSVCRTTPETRREALAWIDQRIAEEGGPSEEAYRRAGERLTRRVKRILTLERTRLLLERAHEIAEDDCPFWLTPDSDFRGREGDEGRLVVMADSMGGASLSFSDGQRSFGGGGTGRVLLGYGVGRRLTIAIGGGVGADGLLPENDDGAREFEALLSLQLPVVFRFNFISRLLDLEFDVTTRLRGSDFQRPGYRFALAYGITTPRTSNVMPYVLAWVGYEVIPGRGSNPASHTLWLGTKVGFDWDP